MLDVRLKLGIVGYAINKFYGFYQYLTLIIFIILMSIEYLIG